VGNEFGSVEALWSQFENFMGRAEEESEENRNVKRKVSEESDAPIKLEAQHEDEGDSTVMQ
jgi:DASH complex subunit DAD1